MPACHLRLIFFFVVLTFVLPAQDRARVEGFVISGSDSIPGATVMLDTAHVTITDSKGRYTLDAPPGNYLLECRLGSEKKFSGRIRLSAGQQLAIDISIETDVNPLDEIVISAERYEQRLGEVTVSTDVIRPALIQNKNFTSLDQVLNQVPGVTVSDGQASIRGGSGFSYGAGSRVLMLVDEMPMISADAGDIKWNFLPLENLEQVEVVKGSSSVLYGSGALNGVVNLRTAFARSKPLTELRMYYGQFDAPRNTYKWWSGSSQSQKGFNFSHARKIGNFDLVIGLHKHDDEGYRLLETEERNRANTNLRYRFKKLPSLSVGVNANMMNVKGGLFFLWQHYDSAYVPRGREIQQYDNNRFYIDPWVMWKKGGDSAGSYHISLRNRYFKTQNTNDKGQGSYAELFYSELQGSRMLKKDLTLTAGLVRMEQVIFGDSIYGQHRGINLAGYAQAVKRIRRLTISGGVRAEYYRLDTARTTGYWLNNNAGQQLPVQPVLRLGMNYRLAAYTYLRASVGQGYRFPSVAEKFVSTSVSSLRILPNPGLQPERALSAEVSVKQGFRIGNFNGFVDLATFYTRYRQMIEFVFDIYKPGGATGSWFDDYPYAGFMSQNVGEAEIAGAELSLSGSGNIGPVKLNVMSGYTFVNPVQVNYNAAQDTLGLPGIKTLKYRSKHLVRADIQGDYKRFSLGYSARYQSKIENIDRRFVTSIFDEYNNSFLNFNNLDQFFILPGLKQNFGAFSKAVLVQDVRIAFRATDFLRVSLIVNNIGNVEYQSRPGDMRPPTSYVGQLLLKF